MLNENSIRLCIHCQSALKENETTQFCCKGCAFVYEYITKKNLQEYYKTLSKLGQKCEPQNDFDKNENVLYDTSDVQILFSLGTNKYGFFIPEIKCAACLWLLENIAKKHSEIKNFRIDLWDKVLYFELENTDQVSVLRRLAKELFQCGYKPYPVTFADSQEFQSQIQKSQLKDLAISGFAAGNIMLFSASTYFGNYFGMENHFRDVFQFLSLILSFPAIVYGGRTFFRNAWIAFQQKKIHVDQLISVSLIFGFCISLLNTLRHNPAIYFDSLTGLVFLLLVGRYFQERLLFQNQKLANSVLPMIPKDSFRYQKGDRVTIPLGGIIPVDGFIWEGETEIQEALLSGEHLPVLKRKGDFVYAGTINLLSPVVVLAEKTGYETFVASLQELIQKAKSTKSHIQNSFEKLLPFFTLFIFFSCLGSLLYWGLINPKNMIPAFTSILMVSCPCALALAPVLTMSAAIKKCWQNGVIVKSSQAFESLSEISAVMLDKTGTLTYLEFFVEQVFNASPAELKIIGELCSRSLHPISKTLSKIHFDCDFFVEYSNLKEIPGQGLEAQVKGYVTPVKIGSAQLIQTDIPKEFEDKFVVCARFDENVIFFILSEKINESSKNLIQFFHHKNISCYLISGDNEKSVHRIAEKIGIQKQNTKSCCKPEDKLIFLENLQKKHTVLFIGDGTNDAPTLAKAHIGLAVSGGVDVALHNSDIFLLSHNMESFQKTILYSCYLKSRKLTPRFS